MLAPQNKSRYFLMATVVAMTVLQAARAHAEVAEDPRTVVVNSTGNVIENSFGNCVRIDYNAGNDACGHPVAAAAPPPPAMVHQQIALEQRTVYFNFNQASLTPDSQAKLDTLSQVLRSDTQVTQANIVGYADRMGSPSYNESLSQKRAMAVRDYLAAHGYVNAQVANTRWFGEQYPTTQCPTNLSRDALIACLAKDRRVEVEIDYRP